MTDPNDRSTIRGNARSRRVRGGWGMWLATALVLAFLAAFLVYPVGYAVKGAFANRVGENTFDENQGKEVTIWRDRWSLQMMITVFGDAALRESIVNSLTLAVVVTLGCAVIALPMAWVAARVKLPGKWLLTGLILVPMIMPPFVGAIGLRTMMARYGTINQLMIWLGLLDRKNPIDWFGEARFLGIALIEILHLFPIMVLNLTAAIANVDPTLEDAAANMGSGGLSRFRRVTLPLVVPGLFAGAIMVFIFSFTDLGTPLIFGYRQLLPVRIFSYLSDIEATNEAYVLVMVVLVLTGGLFLVSKRLVAGRSYAMMARASSSAVEKPVGRGKAILIWVGFGVVLVAALIPHVGVVLTSVTGRWFDTPLPEAWTLDHYSNALSHKLTVSSIRNSLVLSLAATSINVVLGIFIAWVVVRKRPWFADWLDTLVMLPLALPGIVLAFGYLRCFDGVPVLDPTVNPMPLLAVAYAIRRLPYVVRAAVAGLQQTSETLEEASVNMGASPFKTVVRITIPLVLANLISGAILAFSFAMLEVSDSLILARREQHYPITKAIFDLFQRLDDGPYIASALGVWAMVFLALSLIAASVVMGKKMGQIFRA